MCTHKTRYAPRSLFPFIIAVYLLYSPVLFASPFCISQFSFKSLIRIFSQFKQPTIEYTQIKIDAELLEKLKEVRRLETEGLFAKRTPGYMYGRLPLLTGQYKEFQILQYLGQGHQATIYKVQTGQQIFTLKYYDDQQDPITRALRMERRLNEYTSFRGSHMIRTRIYDEHSLLMPYIYGTSVAAIIDHAEAVGIDASIVIEIKGGFRKFLRSNPLITANTLLNFDTGEFIGIDPY